MFPLRSKGRLLIWNGSGFIHENGKTQVRSYDARLERIERYLNADIFSIGLARMQMRVLAYSASAMVPYSYIHILFSLRNACVTYSAPFFSRFLENLERSLDKQNWISHLGRVKDVKGEGGLVFRDALFCAT